MASDLFKARIDLYAQSLKEGMLREALTTGMIHREKAKLDLFAAIRDNDANKNAYATNRIAQMEWWVVAIIQDDITPYMDYAKRDIERMEEDATKGGNFIKRMYTTAGVDKIKVECYVQHITASVKMAQTVLGSQKRNTQDDAARFIKSFFQPIHIPTWKKRPETRTPHSMSSYLSSLTLSL